jgi:hypothetical protein
MKEALTLPTKGEYFTITPQGIEFRAGMPENEWRLIAERLLNSFEESYKSHVQIMFMIGDALAYGEREYGETYADVVDATRAFIRKSIKTLQNASWVAKSVKPHIRHYETLSLAHHEAVATLTEAEQVAYLTAAEAEELTVAELKKRVKASHPKPESTRKPKDVAVVDLADEAGLTHGIEVATRYIKDQADGPETWTKERLRAWQTNVQDIIRAFGMVDSIALTSANSASAYLMEEGPETISKWSEKKKTKWRTALTGLQSAVTALGKPEDPM